MDVEACLGKLGGTNRWILKWFLVIAFAKALPSVFSMFAFQFTASMPKSFHCKVPNNYTVLEFIPQEFRNGKWSFSSCKQFSNGTNSSTIPCQNGYDFTLEYFTSSIVSDWNLVCDREYLRVIATSSFFVMSFVGAIISCNLADHYGRKKIFLSVFACLNLSHLLQAFASHIYVLIVLKLLSGIFQQGCMVTGFTMGIELFSLKDRSNACLVDTFTWTLGCFYLVVLVYFIRDWRYYFVLTTIVMLPFFVMYCHMPESIRWLMSNNRHEEAQTLLKAAARHSRPPVSEQLFDDICDVKNGEELPRYNITYFFRDFLLFRFQVVNMVIWFITAMTFYGLQIKVVEIGNPFLNFFLASLAEIPANIFAFPIANKYGRKVSIGTASILVGFIIPLGYVMFRHIKSSWPATVTFLLGKMLNTVVFNLIFMHTGEIFPTTLRSTAVGMSSSAARLGASLGASLFQISVLNESIPFIFLSVCCVLAGVIVFTLPETYRKKLPTTIEEIREWTVGKTVLSFR